MEGRGEVLVLSSNNYLGLAARPEVVEAGIDGLRRYGRARGPYASSAERSSRTTSSSEGSPTSSARRTSITYVSCWNANEAAIPLADENTVILSDELNHASIIDAIGSHGRRAR